MPRSRSQAGKLSISKGKAFERWVASRLRAIYPEAKRGLQGRGGAEAPDVDIPGWWVECKVGGPAKDPRKALEQAMRDSVEAEDARTPVAVCKLDRREPTVTLWTTILGVSVAVTMSFDDWLRVVKEAK